MGRRKKAFTNYTINKNIAKTLVLHRVWNGYTQTQLAKCINVSFQQIQKYEKATNKVPIDRLLEIGLKTKRDITYFLPRSVEESSNPMEDLKKILVLTEDMEVK